MIFWIPEKEICYNIIIIIMKKIFWVAVFFIGIVLLFGFPFLENKKKEEPKVNFQGGAMQLTSEAFQNNSYIPAKYTCDGEDAAPSLKIADVPSSAKTLALIVDDPDAPSGDFVHWLVWNLPADISEINARELPSSAVQGVNDFGRNGYGGPCPPSGVHHYQFKLYALDSQLNLSAASKKADLEKAMNGHIVAQTRLVGLYARSR